ncbi:hypothetical protein GURASL_08880 [Geotalea uraniireducens]|uniref:histidine kinase n=1 Tax=Geotalea uraniireducens TaxID=351604 RepID=A0ABN6VP05_9BACT|nr:PAS domain S-box protein [Geotalea uraniireducens]BDV41965.1 hypothetical protein GURASL_08880 [Geotalea uraniireducens]
METPETLQEQPADELCVLRQRIAELEQAAAHGRQIQEELEIFRTLINQSNDAIFIVSPGDSRILYVNDKACDNLAYTASELLDKRIYELALNVSNLAEWQKLVARIRKQGYAFFETEQRRRDGSTIPMEINVRLVSHAGHEFFLSVARDLRERQQAQNIIVEEKNKLEAVLTALGDALTVQDTSFRILYQNRIHRQKQGDHLGEYCYRAYQNRETICDGCLLVECFTDGLIHRRQTSARTEAGVLHMEVTASPLRDAAGNIVAAIEVVRDITEIKRGAEALRESQIHLESIVNSVPVILFDLDREGIVTLSTGKGLEKLGLHEGEVVGATVYEQFGDAPAIVASFRQALAGDKVKVTHRVGKLVLDTWLFPVYDPAGTVTGVSGVAIDVSEREEAEQKMRAFNEELEKNVARRTAQLQAVNRELESFSYSVSHDLRAPLRHIRGFIEALEEDCGPRLDDKGIDYIRRIQRAGARMDTLIDHLLALSQVSRTGMEFAPFNLTELCREVADELLAAEPKRQVRFIIAEGMTATGDRHLLRTVMENLIDNAWKYSSRNEQTVIELGMVATGNIRSYFVRDNGVGFDMAHADRLFVPLQRLHRMDEFEGNGIGLATVQRIIARHGGRIWAESAPGQGATFTFTLEPGDPACNTAETGRNR